MPEPDNTPWPLIGHLSEYWPLIGRVRSRDLVSGLWLVRSSLGMSASGNPGPPGNTQLCHGRRGAEMWRSRSRILYFVDFVLSVLWLCGQCSVMDGLLVTLSVRIMWGHDMTLVWTLNNSKFDTLTFTSNKNLEQPAVSVGMLHLIQQTLWSLDCELTIKIRKPWSNKID